jgi:hypothetical protein
MTNGKSWFTIEEPAFDESTYAGRFESMRSTQKMHLIFKSNEEIKGMVKLLERVKKEEAEARQQHGKPHVLRSKEEI